jgi:hypothetical protein
LARPQSREAHRNVLPGVSSATLDSPCAEEARDKHMLKGQEQVEIGNGLRENEVVAIDFARAG